MINISGFPVCPKCEGAMLPFESVENSTSFLKAWMCSNPDCGYGIQMNLGHVNWTKVTEYTRKEDTRQY